MKHQLDLPPNYEPRVYVVDDDESISSSIAELIGSMGYNASTYTSAEEFLADTDNHICGCVIADMSPPCGAVVPATPHCPVQVCWLFVGLLPDRVA